MEIFNTTVLPQLQSDSLTRGEKHRIWNIFMNQANCTDLEAIHSTLNERRDIFSRKLGIDLANHLRIPSTIIDELKSENKLLVGRALRSKWIFEAGSPILNNLQQLIQLLQSTSWACKMKIIHKLGRLLNDEMKAQEIYENLEQLFGCSMASPILPKCSADFIIKKLRGKKNPTLKDWKLLIKMNPNYCMKNLCENMEKMKTEGDGIYFMQRCIDKSKPRKNILSCLAKSDPNLLLEFLEKYGEFLQDFQIGRRLTKTLLKIPNASVRIAQALEKCGRILPKDQTLKLFNTVETFGNFLALRLPKQSDFLYEYNTPILANWAEDFSPEFLFQSLKIAFCKAYKENIEDYYNQIPAKMLQYFPINVRTEIVNLKLQNVDSESGRIGRRYCYGAHNTECYWLRFFPTDESIPKIKEHLRIEPEAEKRGELISFLVSTCAINKDMSSFEDLCGWFVERYRNDDQIVRDKFLYAFQENMKIFKQSMEQWNWDALEILITLYIQSEYRTVTTDLFKLLKSGIQFRLEQGASIDFFVSALVQLAAKSRINQKSIYRWQTCEKFPLLPEFKSRRNQATFLNLIFEKMEGMYTNAKLLPQNLTILLIEVLENLNNWNKKYKKSEGRILISDFPWIVNRINDFLIESFKNSKVEDEEKPILSIHTAFRLLKVVNHSPDFRTQFFSSNLQQISQICVALFEHNKNPKALVENFTALAQLLLMDDAPVRRRSSNNYSEVDYILNSDKESSRKTSRFLENLQLGGYQNLVGMILSKCQEVKSRDNTSKNEMVRALAILSTLDAQIATDSTHLEPFCSSSSRIDLRRTPDAEEEYRQNLKIIESLKFIKPASHGFPIVGRFCKGDYLKLSLGPLYRLCLNSNAQNTLDFLRPLLEPGKPVSLKKHAIRLTCLLQPNVETLKFLSDLWTTETHVSLRHVIFHQTLKILYNSTTTEGTERAWGLIEKIIKSLDDNDRAILREIGGINYARKSPSRGVISSKIPEKYIPTYLKICLDRYTMSGIEVGTLSAFVTNVIGRTDSLPESFLKETIEQLVNSALKSTDYLQFQYINILITKYLHKSALSQKSASALPERLGVIWEIISNLMKDSNWNTKGKSGIYQARTIVKDILKRLCTSLFSYYKENTLVENCAEAVLTYFIEKLDASPKFRQNFFSESIFFRLSKIFYAHNMKSNWGKVSQAVGDLIDEHVTTFRSEIIIGPVADVIKEFINLYDPSENSFFGGRSGTGKPDEATISLADGLLKLENISRGIVIVAANILPSSCPSNLIAAKKYEEVKQSLENWPDDTVKIFLAVSSSGRRNGFW